VGLTSKTLLLVAAFLVVALPLTALVTWQRVPGPQPVRIAQRLSLIVGAQCCAVLLTFVAVNDQYVFYTSWQDLLGRAPATAPITAVGGSVLRGPSGGVGVYRGTTQVTADGGRLITETIHGGRSGIMAQVLVHLPAGYDSSTRRYPVVELLAGWHATPYAWIKSFHILDQLTAAARTDALGPVITVMPTINVGMPRDVECTNVPHGLQAETWLTTDIRDLVLAKYRALSSPRSWGLMGYSTGGYCATKLILHKPQWYGAAVSLAGYFDAVRDGTTGDLWGGSTAYRNENSPLWLMANRPVPAVDLLIFASKQDPEAYPSMQRFLRVVRPPMQTFVLVAPTGGHNLKAIIRSFPQTLTWLFGHLSVGSVAPKVT
jgi:S-formylglutathione hydrolase FrmB